MVDRRGFLKGSAGVLAAGLAGSGFVTGCGTEPSPVTNRGNAADAGIDHIVVVMMENRSFDHLLGWVPGADGRQAGLTFVDGHGVRHPTHHMTGFDSCGFADPGHSYEAGRVEYNGGACDGFLFQAPDTFPISYYEGADLPFWSAAAPAWTICDRYFAATMGPTFPNRMYMHAGQSDRHVNTLDISSMPTIWDRVMNAGLQARYYFSDVPISALWGLKYAPISRSIDGFLSDCAAGRLPNLSFVDPRLLIPPFGNSSDYHPKSDIRLGEQFLTTVYNAVTSSPNWERTVLVVNFDEWGGFYDHVAPTIAPDNDPTLALRGFRVPCMVASPLARRGHVAHDVYDHTSVLRMIEWAWDLEPLTPRDAAANNLADVLDLNSRPDPTVSPITMPPFTPSDCIGLIEEQIQQGLRDLATKLGFPVPAPV